MESSCNSVMKLGFHNMLGIYREAAQFVQRKDGCADVCQQSRGFYHKKECRLLGYKNPVRTSQETHYGSATDSSRLMLCKI
jgi:hypothetical protein